jgi:iron(III) transport system permease protein
MATIVAPAAAAAVRPQRSTDDKVMGVGLAVLLAFLLLAIGLPLWWLLSKSFQDRDGAWVGLANFAAYVSNPSLIGSIWNSLYVSALTTVIVVPLAFVYAYALTRSAMRAKGMFATLALIPILAPSLLPALSLIYLFGNQGFLRWMLLGHSIYGAIGIVIAQVFYCFPFALMILVTALRTSDARLYEAALALRASRPRIFFTVTLPGAKYGVISATFVVFTLVMTDFGIPKVIGGRFDVLATDVYKQVIGQQNFQMGAVVGMVLLVPALLSFVIDRLTTRKQVALLSARAVPFEPKPSARFDWAMFAFCAVVSALIVAILAMAAWGSVIQYWPYNLTLTLQHYDFASTDTLGWGAYWNSLQMAAWTAAIGTVVIFTGAWLIEKGRGFRLLATLAQFLAMLPLAVPGLVLGLAYIFFFIEPANPLNVIYGTLAILVVNSLAHFYTVGHLTATTALKQLDPEFEAVSASLKVPVVRTFWRVTVPVCLPAILDISVYLFVNAMTTVSAVIFLYGADTKLASIAILGMDEMGRTASAAGMAMMIVVTSASVKLLQLLIAKVVLARTQAWRTR